MAVYDRLIDILRGHRVIIQPHDFPDPDAIGSAYGLQYFLKQNGIDSELIYNGKIEKVNTKRIIEGTGILIQNINEVDDLSGEEYIITIDGQKNNSNFTDIPGEEIACIDHHAWTTDYRYEFVDHRRYGACSSIIVSYYMESGIIMPKSVATALLFGIKMDTFDFTRGVTEADICAFAYLHPIADNPYVTHLEKNNLELSDLRAYGVAFEHTVVFDRVGFAHINFDCPDALIAMVSDFILALEAVDVSVVYADREGGYKFSVRSELESLNAGKFIAKALEGIGDGGGHPTMSGGIIPKTSIPLLGKDKEYRIIRLFLDALTELKG